MKHLIKLTAMLSLVLLSTPALSEMMDCPSVNQVKNATFHPPDLGYFGVAGRSTMFTHEYGSLGFSGSIEIDSALWQIDIYNPEISVDVERSLPLYPKLVNKLTTKVYDKPGNAYESGFIVKYAYCEYTGDKVLLRMFSDRSFWVWD